MLPEEEWKQVQRKSGRVRSSSSGNDDNLTSFYVSNLHGGTARSELWDPCAKLGDLLDVYVAGRKDKVGSFFAFVKFSKIIEQEKIDNILKGLQEIEIQGKRIKANCAKHPRVAVKKIAQRSKPTGELGRLQRWQNAWTSRKKTEINLECVPGIANWADNSALIGEVRSFDVLYNFPALFSMEGYDVVDIKYMRGLQVSVKFRTARAAEARKNPGRIVWVKIVGVPVLAWDESNFAAIAGSFGRVLVDVAPFWNCMDDSARKICILTNILRKLNEEVYVSFSGSSHKVGVFEVDDGWTPFSPFSSPSVADSDEDEDRNSDGSENIVLEDGEFVPKTQAGGGDASSE
ncbi:hypothetical protein LXL04_015694 [Taraxacum kok-saghyz]